MSVFYKSIFYSLKIVLYGVRKRSFSVNIQDKFRFIWAMKKSIKDKRLVKKNMSYVF